MNNCLRDLAEVHYGKSPNDVLSEDSTVPVIGTGGIYGRASRSLFSGPAVVVARKGTLGNPQFVDEPFWPVDTTYAVLAKPGVDTKWLYYSLAAFDLTKLNEATGVPSISRDWLYKVPLGSTNFEVQRRIAEILSTLDEAIAQTEALIAKHQQIKAGLMHDLFTRGVTPDGHLRPTREQGPDLYKDSPLGWIPKEWKVESILTLADSLVDGPFGSNLKSEHYVVEPGVRVVRLQNIQEGYYHDRDPVFVAQRHADYLVRNAVNPGDVLIAALGDESYPVGRACCYPGGLPPAINKADCFRLRCHPEMALNTYMMHFLNTTAARNQVKRFEQGVTRRRTNLGNLRRVIAALPKIGEQEIVTQMLAISSEQLKEGELQVEKLRQQKHGLMHDLLAGRVPVNINESWGVQ
ncbi:MAG: restriction endonuclease subunit S [Sulfuricaulis sp.]